MQELNKYLSGLSEHHDMYVSLNLKMVMIEGVPKWMLIIVHRPKIGPG